MLFTKATCLNVKEGLGGGPEQIISPKIKKVTGSLLQTVRHCTLKEQAGFKSPSQLTQDYARGIRRQLSFLTPLLKAGAVCPELQDGEAKQVLLSLDTVPNGQGFALGSIPRPPWSGSLDQLSSCGPGSSEHIPGSSITGQRSWHHVPPLCIQVTGTSSSG